MNVVSITLKRQIIATFVAFVLLFGTPVSVAAASGRNDSRYFIPSTRSFWRNALGARHVFEDGFTADLSDLQLSIAKFAGLKPLPVNKYNILDDESVITVVPTPQSHSTQSVPWGVRATLNDETLTSTSGGAGVTIALLDTGIDREHPDIQSRVEGCYDFTDESKGVIEGSCDDLNGHGTHMAGIMVADGGPTGNGLYGFAPSASISVYRTCNSTGICFADDIAVAMRMAVDNGANIIVLGFGGESDNSLVDSALAYAQEKNVLIIAAAGNDGPYDDSVDWPARNPIVVSVGALDSEKVPAEFSSHGTIEFAAPGVNIESTYRGGAYAILSGTSMAVPHVAGMAARLWQNNASHSADATRELLHTIAVDIAPAGDDQATGWGMLVKAIK